MIPRVVGFIINLVHLNSAKFETSNSEEIITNYILNWKRFFSFVLSIVQRQFLISIPRFWRLSSSRVLLLLLKVMSFCTTISHFVFSWNTSKDTHVSRKWFLQEIWKSYSMFFLKMIFHFFLNDQVLLLKFGFT